MSEANTTQGWRFSDRTGSVVIKGKSHYPASLRIDLDRRSAFDLAMELLRAYRQSPADEAIQVFRMGVMEREPGDDWKWEERLASAQALPPDPDPGPCCKMCGENDPKNLVYVDTHADVSAWRCATCGFAFQTKPQVREE